jgi:drug/metabolite transporter (DMT)-like permease
MAGMGTAQADVTFAFPFITLAAAILGGLVGALIRVLLAAGKRRKLDHRLLIASLLCGVLVFALYAVGVNVLPVSPTVTVGATLVFAVAGLGAFLGVTLLNKGAEAADG